MPPESHRQTPGGTPRSAVVPLSARVKTATDRPSEAATTTARRVCAARETSPAREPPTMTGSRGSTHGASVVRTPATSAPSRASTQESWVWARISSPERAPVQVVISSPSASTCTKVCCWTTPYCWRRSVIES